MEDWELRDLIERTIDEYVKEVPWEGLEMDKSGLINALMEIIKNN